MKRKIFIAIIAALAAMCVLAVSVGAYNWKVGKKTKCLYVVVDGVAQGAESIVMNYMTIVDDTVYIKEEVGTYQFDYWIDSENTIYNYEGNRKYESTVVAHSNIKKYLFAVFTPKSTDPDPDPIPVTLNVQFSAGTGGTASLSDGAPETVVSGETYSFTVTAAAQDGYQFTGWKCGDAVVSTEPVLTFTDAVWTADTTYTAEFEQKAVTPAKVTVTFAAEPGGYLSGDKLSYTVNYGENMPMPAIVAVHEEGYRFAGWYLGEKNVCSGYSFNMDTMRCTEDITITARFVRELKLTFVTELAGTFNGSAEAKFDIGTQAAVNVSVSAKDGYRFLGWYDGDALACSEAKFAYNTTALTEDKTFTAKFAPVEYTICFKAGTGGSVSSGDTVTVKHGEQPAMTASAAADKGYRFIGWYTDGHLACTNSTFALTGPVTASAEYTAKFTEVDYVTITYKSENDTAGYVTLDSESLNPEIGVVQGSQAVAYNFYKFVGWYRDDTLVSENAAFMPAAAETAVYTARFEALPTVSVTFSVAEGQEAYGDVSISGVTAAEGMRVSCKASAKEGFSFVCWIDHTGVVVGEEPEFEWFPKMRSLNSVALTAVFMKNTDSAVLYTVDGSDLRYLITEPGKCPIPAGVEIPLGYRLAWYENNSEVTDFSAMSGGAVRTLQAKVVEKTPVKLTYAVAPECTGKGSIIGTPEEYVNPDTGIASGAEVKPAAGYMFVGWRAEGTDTITDKPAKPDGGWCAATYYAEFRELTGFKVMYISGEPTLGTVSCDGEMVNPKIRAQGCEAIPEEGCRFVGWYEHDNDVARLVSTDAKFIPTDGQGAVYTAHFERLPVTPVRYEVTITSGSASAEYSGSALTCDDFGVLAKVIMSDRSVKPAASVINGNTIAVGNTQILLTMTGMQTDVGTSKNTFTAEYIGEPRDTIHITSVFGALTVTAAAEKDADENTDEKEEEKESSFFLPLSGFVRVHNHTDEDIEFCIFNERGRLVSAFTVCSGKYRGASLKMSGSYVARRMDTGEEFTLTVRFGEQKVIILE